MINTTVKSSQRFFFGSLLVIEWISLIDQELLRLYISPVNLCCLFLQELVHFKYIIKLRHRVVYSLIILMYSGWVVMIPLSCKILAICVAYVYFFLSIARSLLILLIFIKEPTSFHWFSVWFSVSKFYWFLK